MASLRRKPEPGFEPRSNQASKFPAQERRRSGPCTSSAGATFFQASTARTTLSRATPCPRELSTTVSVVCAHVTVCVKGRTRPRRCPPRLLPRVPPELKPARCQKVLHPWPPPSYAGPRLAAPCRSANRPWQYDSASPYDSSSQCANTVPLRVVLLWGFLFHGLASRSSCVLCGVCVVSLLWPFVLVRCCSLRRGPAGPCAGVFALFCGSVLRSGFWGPGAVFSGVFFR